MTSFLKAHPDYIGACNENLPNPFVLLNPEDFDEEICSLEW